MWIDLRPTRRPPCLVVLAMLLGSAAFLDSAAAPAQDAAPARDAAPAYMPADLTVPPGLRVELAAAPPLLHHPTMIAMDDRGRLLVAESSGQNLNAEQLLQQQPGRILMLQDQDDDGRFDTSHVFADHVTLPQGVLCYRDAVYVCSPPSLFRFRDTDGDGRADQRTVLVDGFGFTGNAASVHGPFLAPSGRLFICQGRKPHELRDADGRLVDVGLAARIWSCRLDGTDLRQHAGGGMDNPVEVDFTDDGQVLGTVNLLHANPRDDALVHWMFDGVYPRADQIPSLAEFRSTGPLLNTGVHFGHIAVSGVTRYRGQAMGDLLADRWLVTEFNRGRLLSVTLRPDGASFQGDYQPLLTCNGENFHPTDVMQDDRGDLLLVDTGGWFRHGCPTSRYARPELAGAIYRIRPDGDLRPRPQPLAAEPADEVLLRIEQLDDPNATVVGQAVDRLAEIGTPAIAAIGTRWDQLSEAARLQAIWAICRSRAPESVPQLMQFAADAQQPAAVRVAALAALGAYPDPAAWPVAVAAIKDPQPRVARQAAALVAQLVDGGAVPDPRTARRAARSAWRRLPQIAGDPALEHQLAAVLIRLQARDWIAATSLADLPPVQGRAALLMAKAAGESLPTDDLLALAQVPDAATRGVAIEALLQPPRAAEAIVSWAARQLLELSERGGGAANAAAAGITADELQTILTSQIDQPAAVPVVAGVLRSAPPTAQRVALQAIAAGPSQPMPDAWESALRRLIAGDDIALQLAAVDAAGRLIAADDRSRAAGDGQMRQLLQSIGRQEDAPLALRVAAWRASAGGQTLPGEGFQLLVDQLDPANLSPQRRDAASILAQVALSSDQLKRLASDYLPRLHPLDLPVVLEAFAASRSSAAGQALLQALAGSSERITGSVTLEQLDRVLRRYDETLQRDAEPIRARLRAAETERIARLAKLRDVLPPGDVQRGAAVFASEQAACGQCHRVGSQGEAIGPDLSQIGHIRTTDDLLESIVLPSATIARDFETHSVLTSDGRLLAGLVKRLADGSVEVIGADAKPHAVAADEIEAITPSPTSVMPAGLDAQLTPQQLSDLIAYLRSLDKG